jgi:PDZ domain-containing secreted protein
LRYKKYLILVLVAGITSVVARQSIQSRPNPESHHKGPVYRVRSDFSLNGFQLKLGDEVISVNGVGFAPPDRAFKELRSSIASKSPVTLVYRRGAEEIVETHRVTEFPKRQNLRPTKGPFTSAAQ